MDGNRSFNLGKSHFFLLAFTIAALCIESDNDSCHAQILDGIRLSSRSPSPPSSDPPKSPKRDRDRHHHYDDDKDSNLIGSIIGAVLFGSDDSSSNSSSNSSVSMEFHDSDHQSDIDYGIYAEPTPDSIAGFNQFPYEDGNGIIIDSKIGQPSQRKFAFWYGTDFDDIDTWNTQIRFDNSDSIGFDFQWAHLREKLVGLPSDSLNLMDFNVTTMWIKRENVVVRAGGGINLLSDNFGTEVDYNLTMSAELFPVKPLVMNFEIDHGELGSTHQTHLLSTVGLNLRQAEFMTGYEFRKIGRTELKRPILGMRIWW